MFSSMLVSKLMDLFSLFLKEFTFHRSSAKLHFQFQRVSVDMVSGSRLDSGETLDVGSSRVWSSSVRNGHRWLLQIPSYLTQSGGSGSNFRVRLS